MDEKLITVTMQCINILSLSLSEDMEVTLPFYRHSSRIKLANNLKRNTNKFIKISATSTKYKESNSRLFDKEERAFSIKR